jgi:hypothetical protein
MDGKTHLGVRQSLQQVFAGLLKLVDRVRFLRVKILILFSHYRVDLLTDSKVMPQFVHQRLQRLGHLYQAHGRLKIEVR